MKTLKRIRFVFPFIALLGLLQVGGGCAAKYPSVKQDPQADTSRYRTYRWVGEPEAQFLHLDNPNIDYLSRSSKIERRLDVEPQLKEVVNRELVTRGMTETSGLPDFYVTYYGKTKDENWVSTWTGSTPSINNVPVIMYPDFDRASARSYLEGSLLLVFYDANSRRPAWTGTMPNVLEGKQVKLETVTARLGELVQEFKSTA